MGKAPDFSSMLYDAIQRRKEAKAKGFEAQKENCVNQYINYTSHHVTDEPVVKQK